MVLCRPADPTRTGAIMAAIVALLEERRADFDTGLSFDSLTLVVKLRKTGYPERVIYRPERVQEL